MRQVKKPSGSSKAEVDAVFDKFFGKASAERPASSFEYAKTVLASAEVRERISEIAGKTQFADPKLMEEMGAYEKGKKKREIKTIPFNGGYFKIIRELSSDVNSAGDVYLAEKITSKNGKEHFGELVVLKMLKDEEEIVKGLNLNDAEKEYLVRRMFQEAGMEINNLNRLNHPHIVSATGEAVLFCPEGKEGGKARLVSQMEYVPHAFDNYLWSAEGENRLTNDVLEAGIQILDAISYLENYRSEGAPDGLVHNDFKLGNMGAIIKDGRLVVKMLDLDSIRPIAELVSATKEMKYSPDHCDPEEFMELHETEIAVNAKPAETIYPLGIALLHSIAKRLCIPLEIRDLRVGGYAYEEEVEHVPTARSTMIPGLDETIERTTRVSVINPDRLREALENAREADERNLMRVYLANEKKRRASGKTAKPPPEMKKLLEKHDYVIRAYLQPEIEREINWVGDRRLSPDEMEKMSKEDIAKHFGRLLADFKLDKGVEERCDLNDDHEKLLFGIKNNIRKLTREYARNNYRWYPSAHSHFSKTHEWQDALNNMLMEIAGLERKDAAEIVELAKREERGREMESVVHPEVFEAIAHCLKPRKERLDAERLKRFFEMKRNEVHNDFPEAEGAE